ncbi:MAG: glycoside hydrolase family 108 protein, partial [Oceanicaulis sp.]
MAQFERALEVVLKWEGGFSNNPADPGGATNLGITQETLRLWRGAPVGVEDVRNLTLEEAREIYRTLYWDVCRCAEMEWAAALMVFDAAVNHGPRQAALFLQRVVDVEADGTIGPLTLAATNANPETVAEEVGARRMAFYGELANFGIFGFGWSRRLMNILRVCVQPFTPEAEPVNAPEDADPPDADPPDPDAPAPNVTIPYAPGRGPGREPSEAAARWAFLKPPPS